MAIDFQIPLKDGAVLRCSRFPAQSPGTSKSLIVIAHGYKGFKDWGMFPHAAEYLSRNHEIVTFNFSHNGIGDEPDQFTELEKFAVNTYDRELSDLNSLIAHLQSDLQFHGLPLFLLGHSRGAGVCLVYALDHPGQVRGVISWNGITNLNLFSDKQKEEMREAGRSYVLNGRTGQQMPLDRVILEDLDSQRDRYDILGRMALGSGSDFSAVLIQGSEDGAHLRKGSAELVKLRPDISLIQIQGGNHTFGTVHPFQGFTESFSEALQATQSFIAATVGASSSPHHDGKQD
ncbi:alpha-beta hydrolase superfamily lysophospholipase [Fontibacillus phaseoli]|uniref:Alpha-beta hydrolase superfamily lysophospholipase n=1 Tax=Fontibacillus phaseoli TaxID=1416533 RepID=A0A369B3X9_9BACL|nr:alpha/beta fold hydrolase [Fontibacillus phaseoli]RCX16203.1 alpha-beta hydrolase superfamily lysophospholipase [Fontibacillus phaseoli]